MSRTERKWLSETFRQDYPPRFRQTKGVNGDNRSFDLEQSYQAIHDPATNTRLLQVVGRDISVWVDLEKRREEFISMTSHELRTPLTAIKGCVEILKGSLGEARPATKVKCLDIIWRNVQRIGRLIEGVSTLGQVERGQFSLIKQDVNIREFLTTALQSYQTQLGAQLEWQSCPEGSTAAIEGDPDRLQQVIDNLLENAVKQTPRDQRKILVTLEILPQVVRVLVADNGVGIALPDLNRIFEPFVAIPTQYSVGGTGIGLYLSRMLVKAHGGSLTAQSAGKGQGATFILELPKKEGIDHT